jgi:hypothetical protein
LDRRFGGPPRAILDMVVKRKISSPHQESNPRTPIIQPVAQHYTDQAITAWTHESVSVGNILIMIWIMIYIFCFIKM